MKGNVSSIAVAVGRKHSPYVDMHGVYNVILLQRRVPLCIIYTPWNTYALAMKPQLSTMTKLVVVVAVSLFSI